MEALEQRVARNEEATERAFRTIDTKLDALASNVSGLRSDRDKVAGGWLTLTGIAGAAGAAGSLLTWFMGRP